MASGSAIAGNLPGWHGKFEFDFSDRVPGDPSEDVESAPAFVGLRDAVGYPASIQWYRPKSCRLGPTMIADEHISLKIDDKPLIGIYFALPDDKLHKFQLVLDGEGRYGDLTGIFTCALDGNLVYSF
jgi:hypothetical protein